MPFHHIWSQCADLNYVIPNNFYEKRYDFDLIIIITRFFGIMVNFWILEDKPLIACFSPLSVFNQTSKEFSCCTASLLAKESDAMKLYPYLGHNMHYVQWFVCQDLVGSPECSMNQSQRGVQKLNNSICSRIGQALSTVTVLSSFWSDKCNSQCFSNITVNWTIIFKSIAISFVL